MNADDLTIFIAQREQPWTVPYGENKWWVVLALLLLAACSPKSAPPPPSAAATSIQELTVACRAACQTIAHQFCSYGQDARCEPDLARRYGEADCRVLAEGIQSSQDVCDQGIPCIVPNPAGMVAAPAIAARYSYRDACRNTPWPPTAAVGH